MSIYLLYCKKTRTLSVIELQLQPRFKNEIIIFWYYTATGPQNMKFYIIMSHFVAKVADNVAVDRAFYV